MKKIILSCLLFSLAHVAYPIPYSGSYVGILVGSSDMNYTSDNQGLGGASKNEADGAFYGFAGMQFNRNFALQTGYLQFADVTFSGINGISGTKSDYSQKALELAGRFIYPLSSVATVYVKGGMALVNLDRQPNAVSATYTIPRGDKTKIQPIYGMGFTYEFYPNLSGEVNWTEISGSHEVENANFVGLGVNLAVN
jgi:hypothetical protein